MKVIQVLALGILMIMTYAASAQQVTRKSPSEGLTSTKVPAPHLVAKQKVTLGIAKDKSLKERVTLALSESTPAESTFRTSTETVIYITKEQLRSHSSSGNDAAKILEAAKKRAEKH